MVAVHDAGRVHKIPLIVEMVEQDQILIVVVGKILAMLVHRSPQNGVGQRVAALLAEGGRAPKQLILKNLGRTFALEGTVAQLEHRFELDAAGIAAAVREAAGYGRG